VKGGRETGEDFIPRSFITCMLHLLGSSHQEGRNGQGM